jgi:hypothetical protein
MIGIYKDDFLQYLKDNLGDKLKISRKNIICPCPWCEFQKDKNHYHLYISLEAPIFHCFHGGCERGGVLAKFISKIEGHDISDAFIDKEKMQEISKQKEVFVVKDEKLKTVHVPQLRPDKFLYKDMYVKKRLKFSNIPTRMIKGLVYDVHSLIEMNNIPIDETLFRLKDYLHSNFVGFLTENQTAVMFRNIDHSHSMKFFKMKIQFPSFLDYYRLPGGNKESNKVVLAEGIFDIYTEHIYDFLKLRSDVRLYASVLSSKYAGLIQSLVYHEQVFRPDVIILSDRGVEERYYQNLQHYNKHVINSLAVYYNKTGKDFNTTPVTPVRIDIRRRTR